MTPSPRVAVLVLSHNRKADVLACLASVRNLTLRPTDVVLVDNASTDGTADAVAQAFPEVLVIRNRENLGAVAGRNAGWNFIRTHTRAEFVLTLDDDTIVDPRSLSRLVEVLQADPRAGIACGKTYTRRPSRTIMSAGIRVNRYTGAVYDRGAGLPDDGRYDEPGYVDACGACAWLIRLEVIEALDGLDERFNPYGWEEVDFCLRAAARGYRARYTPQAVFHHAGSKVGRNPVPRYERYKVRNYLLLLGRHTTALQRVSCLVCAPCRAALVMARMVRGGHVAAIAAQWRGLGEGLRALLTRADRRGATS
jgi:hypothetical protein